MAPKRRIPDPAPGDNGVALERIAAFFQAKYPEEWASIAKCPLEACLPVMVEMLKGKG